MRNVRGSKEKLYQELKEKVYQPYKEKHPNEGYDVTKVLDYEVITELTYTK